MLAYQTHKTAVHEFRPHPNVVDRLRLDHAWTKYHGGNEDRPDFLVLYGIPENGADVLKHGLEILRSFGNKT